MWRPVVLALWSSAPGALAQEELSELNDRVNDRVDGPIWPSNPYRTAESERNVRKLRKSAGSSGALAQPEQPKRNKLSVPTLSAINSIDCLQRKQKNPQAACDGDASDDSEAEQQQVNATAGILNMGNYPSWRAAECNSHGAFFCDPQGLLEGRKVQDLTQKLHTMEDEVRVQCGATEAKVKGDATLQHDRRFNLGVAVARGWPSSETDGHTLHKFGMLLMMQWGMLPFYNGVDGSADSAVSTIATEDQLQTNCPNAAVLIVLPDHDIAYLAAPGCEFICEDRGGDLVSTAVRSKLETHGLGDAIDAGISEVRALLKELKPLGLEGFGARHYWRRQESLQDRMARSEQIWIYGVRALFAVVVLITVFILFTVLEQLMLQAWDPSFPLKEPTREEDEHRALSARLSRCCWGVWDKFLEVTYPEANASQRVGAGLLVFVGLVVILTVFGLVTLLTEYPP